ncbi:MAG: branched-chain amino acid ABC transporter permease, partial [Desulfocapsa sp.]|nr:branched-chain amino acid ABC transporter permease [Desulfocapsa sp.]
YYLCLAILVIFLVVAKRLVRSHFGRVISACCENEQRVQVLGFESYRYKLACYTFSAAAAGLAGVLLVNQSEFISPGLMHWTKSGELMVMVLLGGMGTLVGPVLGAATLLLMEDILAMYTEHWMIILGPFLIIVVLFAKRGLYGLLVGTENGHE